MRSPKKGAPNPPSPKLYFRALVSEPKEIPRLLGGRALAVTTVTYTPKPYSSYGPYIKIKTSSRCCPNPERRRPFELHGAVMHTYIYIYICIYLFIYLFFYLFIY